MYIKYRVYADGSVYHEDEFDTKDHSVPYYDDYETFSVPEVLVDYITEQYIKFN